MSRLPSSLDGTQRTVYAAGHLLALDLILLSTALRGEPRIPSHDTVLAQSRHRSTKDEVVVAGHDMVALDDIDEARAAA
jgi:hypothetical protein